MIHHGEEYINTHLFRLWQDVTQSSQFLGSQRLAVTTAQVLNDSGGGNPELTQEDVDLKTLLIVEK